MIVNGLYIPDLPRTSLGKRIMAGAARALLCFGIILVGVACMWIAAGFHYAFTHP